LIKEINKTRCFVDLIGRVFGRLTVKRLSDNLLIGKNKKLTYWHCECICGKEVDVLATVLKDGTTISCGCYRLEAFNMPYGEANLNKILNGYERGARKRGLEFSLTREDFREITQQSCSYCGIEPLQHSQNKANTGLYIYNGIDRIDPLLGYRLDNIVTACKQCNTAKMIKTKEEFFNKIKLIYFKFFIQDNREIITDLKPFINQSNGQKTAMDVVYNEYGYKSKYKNIIFDLTKNDFCKITKQNCYYCGEIPSRERIYKTKRINDSFVYNGIDRIDSDFGYIEGNMVPCCTDCNYMKNNLSLEDFLNWVYRVYKYSIENKL